MPRELTGAVQRSWMSVHLDDRLLTSMPLHSRAAEQASSHSTTLCAKKIKYEKKRA